MAEYSKEYDDLINENAEKYGVDAKLIKSVIYVESSFDEKAESKAGCQGLMQLKPSTFKSLMGTSADIWNPADNIEAGTKYLKEKLDTFDGDTEKALAAYNAGNENVKKNGKEKYKSYYTKVMNVYEDMGGLSSGGSGGSKNTNLVWWGDIVKVVFIILLILIGILFLIGSMSGGLPSKSEIAQKVVKKKVKK